MEAETSFTTALRPKLVKKNPFGTTSLGGLCEDVPKDPNLPFLQ